MDLSAAKHVDLCALDVDLDEIHLAPVRAVIESDQGNVVLGDHRAVADVFSLDDRRVPAVPVPLQDGRGRAPANRAVEDQDVSGALVSPR